MPHAGRSRDRPRWYQRLESQYRGCLISRLHCMRHSSCAVADLHASQHDQCSSKTRGSCQVKRQRRLRSCVGGCAACRGCVQSVILVLTAATASQALYRANIAAYHRVDPAGVAAGARPRYGPVYGPRYMRVCLPSPQCAALDHTCGSICPIQAEQVDLLCIGYLSIHSLSGRHELVPASPRRRQQTTAYARHSIGEKVPGGLHSKASW